MDGKDTSLWYEPWLKEGRLVELVDHDTPQITGSQKWKVNSIILNGHWNLSIPVLGQVWSSITDIQITQGIYTWIWTAESSAIFSFSSAWDHVRQFGELFALHDMVWFPHSNPMMSSCLLKGILDKLPTRSRLYSFGILNSDSCVLCNSDSETRDHLFFACPYSAYLWSLCKLKMKLTSVNLGNLVQEAESIKEAFTVKDKSYILIRSAFSATVWHI